MFERSHDTNAAGMAMNKGLLVIRAIGDSAIIINKPGFVANTWQGAGKNNFDKTLGYV